MSGKSMAGPGSFSAGGEPLPALCRLLLLIVIFSVFPTPVLCPPVPPPFVATSKALDESCSILTHFEHCGGGPALQAPPSVPACGVR